MTDYEFPQISVIVPIYNNETYLRECLNSILAQTFANWEAILVNDGSTDNTGAIIDEYAEKDSRFIAVHKRNEGTLLARKCGLEHSKGEFIANIDHDDIYNPQFLEKMHEKIKETNADFVYCNHDNHGSVSELADYEWSLDVSQNIASALAWEKLTLLVWDKLIKREIYSKIHFPNTYLTFLEDQIQMIQVVRHSKSSAFVPEILYFHRAGGLSAVVKPTLVIKGTIAIKKIMEDFFNENVKRLFYHQYAGYALHCYYQLDKKTREEFKDELEPMLPEVIKTETRLNLKICLFLASKGMEFPIMLRNKLICLKKFIEN